MHGLLECIALKHLLTTIVQRATKRSIGFLPHKLFQDTRKSKIYEYQLLTVRTKAYIIWFDIHMNDVHLMQQIQLLLKGKHLHRAKMLFRKIISFYALLHWKLNAIFINHYIEAIGIWDLWTNFELGSNFKNCILFDDLDQTNFEIISFYRDAFNDGLS